MNELLEATSLVYGMVGGFLSLVLILTFSIIKDKFTSNDEEMMNAIVNDVIKRIYNVSK